MTNIVRPLKKLRLDSSSSRAVSLASTSGLTDRKLCGNFSLLYFRSVFFFLLCGAHVSPLDGVIVHCVYFLTMDERKNLVNFKVTAVRYVTSVTSEKNALSISINAHISLKYLFTFTFKNRHTGDLYQKSFNNYQGRNLVGLVGNRTYWLT